MQYYTNTIPNYYPAGGQQSNGDYIAKPQGLLSGDISFALFNIQDLGGGPARSSKRKDEEINGLANVIRKLHKNNPKKGITVILEVKNKAGGYKSIFDAVVEDIRAKKSGANRESRSHADTTSKERFKKSFREYLENKVIKYSIPTLISIQKIMDKYCDQLFQCNDDDIGRIVSEFFSVDQEKIGSQCQAVACSQGENELQRIAQRLPYKPLWIDQSLYSKNEACAILYDCNQFYINPTPLKIFPHFYSGRQAYLYTVCNTRRMPLFNVIIWHAPYTNVCARLEGYELLKNYIILYRKSAFASIPLLVAGDFNSTDDKQISTLQSLVDTDGHSGLPPSLTGVAATSLRVTPKNGSIANNFYDHIFLSNAGNAHIKYTNTISPVEREKMTQLEKRSDALSDHCALQVELSFRQERGVDDSSARSSGNQPPHSPPYKRVMSCPPPNCPYSPLGSLQRYYPSPKHGLY